MSKESEKEEEVEKADEYIVDKPVDEIVDEWGFTESYDTTWINPDVNLDIGDNFMMLLKEKDKKTTFIGQVSGINPDDGIVFLLMI